MTTYLRGCTATCFRVLLPLAGAMTTSSPDALPYTLITLPPLAGTMTTRRAAVHRRPAVPVATPRRAMTIRVRRDAHPRVRVATPHKGDTTRTAPTTHARSSGCYLVGAPTTTVRRFLSDRDDMSLPLVGAMTTGHPPVRARGGLHVATPRRGDDDFIAGAPARRVPGGLQCDRRPGSWSAVWTHLCRSRLVP